MLNRTAASSSILCTSANLLTPEEEDMMGNTLCCCPCSDIFPNSTQLLSIILWCAVLLRKHTHFNAATEALTWYIVLRDATSTWWGWKMRCIPLGNSPYTSHYWTRMAPFWIFWAWVNCWDAGQTGLWALCWRLEKEVFKQMSSQLCENWVWHYHARQRRPLAKLLLVIHSLTATNPSFLKWFMIRCSLCGSALAFPTSWSSFRHIYKGNLHQLNNALWYKRTTSQSN